MCGLSPPDDELEELAELALLDALLAELELALLPDEVDDTMMLPLDPPKKPPLKKPPPMPL